MEAVIGVMYLQAKKYQGLSETTKKTRRKAGNKFSLTVLKGTNPAHLDPKLLSSRTVRE